MSELKQCECPCHKEGLWKLPDEIAKLKELMLEADLILTKVKLSDIRDIERVAEFLTILREAAK